MNTGSGYYLQKYKQNTGAGNETKKFNDLKNRKPNIFTTAGMENINHNSTSSTAQNHFNETSISVFTNTISFTNTK